MPELDLISKYEVLLMKQMAVISGRKNQIEHYTRPIWIQQFYFGSFCSVINSTPMHLVLLYLI